MSYVRTSILLVVVLTYIVAGGLVIHFLETAHEQQTIANLRAVLQQFLENNTCVNRTSLMHVLGDLVQLYKVGFSDETGSETNWDYYNSIFFATTVLSTIGYGNIVPKTSVGRLFTVLFAVIGIPLFLALLVSIGHMQWRALDFLVLRRLPGASHASDDGHKTPAGRWISRHVLRIVVNAAVFVAVFCILPAAIFYYFEKWSFGESVYFAVVTTTTIGFGDYVAGASTDVRYRGLYRLCVACWIILGLASCASLISTIQDAYSVLMVRAEARVSAVQAVAVKKGEKAGTGVSTDSSSLSSDISESSSSQ